MPIDIHDAARLKELQALPLNRKIAITQARIIEWYNAYEGNVYVSLSGGKDSTVLLHLVRQLFPDVPAVFSNTGLEYPEIQKFAKSFDNVTTVTPKMNFVNVIRTYGYPLISKEVANAIYYARRIRPYNTSSDGGAEQQSENRKNSLACEQTRGGGRESQWKKLELLGIRPQNRQEYWAAPPREQLNSKQGRVKKQNQRELSERSASWDSG